MHPNTGPHDLTPWLADATSTSPEQVEEELEEGERRRAFVVNELVEAGFAGSMLLLQVIKLTGVDDVTAHALIAAQARAAPPAKADVPKRDRRLAENEILFRQGTNRSPTSSTWNAGRAHSTLSANAPTATA